MNERYNAWARELMKRRPRVAGLWLMLIGVLSTAVQLAVFRLGMYSRVGVFLAPLVFVFGLWHALAGRPWPHGQKAPLWWLAGLGGLSSITAAFCAAVVARL
jgi:hypothetical protein